MLVVIAAKRVRKRMSDWIAGLDGMGVSMLNVTGDDYSTAAGKDWRQSMMGSGLTAWRSVAASALYRTTSKKLGSRARSGQLQCRVGWQSRRCLSKHILSALPIRLISI